jgi:predicted nucleotidyltransferase
MIGNTKPFDKACRGIIERARADQDVLAVMVYGSRARGEGTPTSDMDICLVLHPVTYSQLELSQKKLEYLKSFEIDLQVYQQLPIYIKRRILREGETLFCRDEDKLYEVAYRTAQEFEDFKHIYYNYLEEIGRG